jgi:hypothetical protein
MKIKNFKIEPRLKEVYNNLKQKGIKITPEVETLVSVVDKEIKDLISPAVVFDTFDISDDKIKSFLKTIQVTKNAEDISFIVSTLGSEIEKFFASINEDVKRNIAEVIVLEYLNSSINFVIKLLEEKTEQNLQPSSIFLLPDEFYEEIINLLSADKIGVSYSQHNKQIFPVYTSLNYFFWFKTKK